MKEIENYIEINRKLWNAKTPIHVKSDFYENEIFLKGKSSLKSIETDLMGDVAGKSILHLQCHFGQDSISLARLGAKVTGIDLSDEAIKVAGKMANDLNVDAKFICCDIYDLPNQLSEEFDIVFTSYGTIGWLPDLDKWASVVSRFLKKNGKFVFVEFHPFIWMLDDNFEKFQFSYFNDEAIVEENEGTYTNFDSDIKEKSVSWNHPLSEVFSNLLNHGLSITHFAEYDFSPYNCFQNLEKLENDKFRFKHIPSKIPLLYSILATK
ncbi:MAG: class I SAM-dependent methyltransferase [Melioribacteraceae bacterium]|nr:class I SAM-dependent methyltransferase [Melioribacteraceae bacterium]MCF8263033.1 class I SAM-dependent methyltransferase [Melioribacteraceae bacterium]MCF8430478.1 class I SAM-dependent methyltransferase [Melioribacteraceae bacterium]